MEYIVVGTHEYEWATAVFARLFNKYWNSVTPVTYWCDREPKVRLPDNFTARQVPAYKEGIWPWNNWFSNGLKSILETLREQHVALFLPDHWLSAPVDLIGVEQMHRYMMFNEDVLRGNLTAGTCLDGYGIIVKWLEGRRVVQVSPTDAHCALYGGLTFSPALWDVRKLASHLESGWNLWMTERVGTEKMAREGKWRSVGILPAPLERTHGLSQREPRTAFLNGLQPEDRRMVIDMLPEGWNYRD